MVYVDADKARALALLGAGADGAAKVGPAQNQQQHRRGGERPAKGHHLGQRDQRAGKVDGGQRVGGVYGARVGLECVERKVFQDDGNAQRDEQDIFILAVAGAADDKTLQGVTEGEHRRHHDG